MKIAKSQRLSWMLTMALGLGAQACNTADFNAETRKRATTPPPSDQPQDPTTPTDPTDPTQPVQPVDPNNPPVPGQGDEVQKVIELGCNDNTGMIGGTEAIAAPANQKVIAKVKGKFCPTSRNFLTVAFVVDFSGSMGGYIDPVTGALKEPNDPLINGSCGRLRAAQAVINQINTTKKATDTVKIALIPFSSKTFYVINPTDLSQFMQYVTPERFCRFVAQTSQFEGRSGAITQAQAASLGIPSPASGTNYQAGLQHAESMLRSANGRKIVYFISDGVPTIPSPDTNAASLGIAAGKSLRERVNNMTLNGLLLGSEGAAAQSTLEQVAGDASRVRIADNASELASEITKFAEATIDTNTGRWFQALPYRQPEMPLASFQRIGSTNEWAYETPAFVLLGVQGRETLNQIIVTAKGADGSTHTANVTIRYTQQ